MTRKLEDSGAWTASDVTRDILARREITQTAFAAMLGLKTYHAVQTRLSKPNITSDNLEQMLRALGYEVVIQPISSGRRPPNSYVLGAPK
jgi:hypothetical protein